MPWKKSLLSFNTFAEWEHKNLTEQHCSHFSMSAGHVELYTPSTLSLAQLVSTIRHENGIELQHCHSDTPELHRHWDNFINTARHWNRIFTCNDANEILNHYYMKIVILSSAKVRLLGISTCSKKKNKLTSEIKKT